MSNIETPTLFYLAKAEEYNDPIREDTYCLFNIITDKLILSQVFASEITDFLLFNNPSHPWLNLSNESSEDWALSISEKQMTLPLEWSSSTYGSIYSKDYSSLTSSLTDYLVKPTLAMDGHGLLEPYPAYPTNSVKVSAEKKVLNEKELDDIVSGLKEEIEGADREVVDRVLSNMCSPLDDIEIDIESIPYIEDE